MIAPQFLRANPRLRGRGAPYIYGIGGPSPFEALYAQATVVGSPALPLLNTSDGNRNSVFDGGDVRATNLVDTDLTNWTKGASTPAVIDNGDGSFRVQLPDGAGTYLEYPVSFASSTYTIAMDVMCTPGESCAGMMKIVSTGGTNKTYVTGYAPQPTWQTIYFSQSDSNTNDKTSIADDVGSGGIDITIRNIRLTNTATPVSAFPVGSGPGFTKVDQVKVNGIFVESSLKGDENLLPTDPSSFNANEANVDITDLGGGAYLIKQPNAPLKDLMQSGLTLSGDYTVTFDLRNNPTSIQPGQLRVNTDGNTYFSAVPPSDWTTVTVTANESSGSTITFRAFSGGVEYEIRNIRFVNSSAPAAGFTDGSPAGTDYIKDGLTFSGIYTSPVTLQMAVRTYGWSDDGNPVNAECVLFEAGPFQLLLSATGLIQTNGGAISTKKLSASAWSVITVICDGVNHTIQVDGETPVVAASAILPADGTSRLGDRADGLRTSHALEHLAVYPRALTPVEITTGEDGYQARIGSIVPV